MTVHERPVGGSAEAARLHEDGWQASFYVGAVGLCDECIAANASVPVRRAA